MAALDLVNLRPLMELSQGAAEVLIGLIDGPVAVDHPDLAHDGIRTSAAAAQARGCTEPGSVACRHGTFIAGILSARRGSAAPAICPGCTLLVHPIFPGPAAGQLLPSAAPDDLAEAILACVEAGAAVLNLSVALARPSAGGLEALDQALDICARREVLVVAAAGNQGLVGSSPITRHPWVIPVVACDLAGAPLEYSNLGNSIGRFGLRAPGTGVTSLVAGAGGDEHVPLPAGTSVAVPFVTGAAALLRSHFPTATAAEVKLALTGAARRATVVPPLLNAWAACQILLRSYPGGPSASVLSIS